jgi:hypothetical protein
MLTTQEQCVQGLVAGLDLRDPALGHPVRLTSEPKATRARPPRSTLD